MGAVIDDKPVVGGEAATLPIRSMCGLTKAVLSTQHSLGEVTSPVLDRPSTPRPRQVAFAETNQLGMIPLSQLLDQSLSPAAITSL
jgi:hypothetical protein